MFYCQVQLLLFQCPFTPYYIGKNYRGNKRKNQRSQNIGNKVGKLGRSSERHNPLQQLYNPTEHNSRKGHGERTTPLPARRRDPASHTRKTQVKRNSKTQTAEHKEMPDLVKPLEYRNFNLRQRMRIQRQKKNSHHHYTGEKSERHMF